MRLLVTIAHYFKPQPKPGWLGALGSGCDPLARVAALNSEIVSLHRYFGTRLARDPTLKAQDMLEANTLDRNRRV